MRAPYWRRICRVVALAAAVAALVAVCGSCASRRQRAYAEHCAIMPDTVGLYVNNPVTQMGVPVGKVTAITPEALHVRVNFTVDETRQLPDDVKAVIRSGSILADRSLELAGTYDAGRPLSAAECIPLGRSFTPKSLSQIIGASTDFINAINPQGSTNTSDVLNGIDRAFHGQGADINKLLSSASGLLDSPDRAIGDIGSIVKNLAQLTSTIRAIDPTLKKMLEELEQVGPDISATMLGADKIFHGLIPLITMVADLETELGGETQQTLDSVSVVLRKLTPRMPFYASLLNVAPRLINGIANFAQTRGNSGFAAFTLRYRPPLYRIATPDGWAQCGIMNAAVPGSCANVAGMPHAIDVALLQYVLTEAAKR